MKIYEIRGWHGPITNEKNIAVLNQIAKPILTNHVWEYTGTLSNFVEHYHGNFCVLSDAFIGVTDYNNFGAR
jgi:hypothetical protein